MSELAPTHLGLARMERATWRPTVTFRLPHLSRAAHWALWGRLAVFTAVAVILTGLTMFARPEATRAYDKHGAGFRWSAIEPGTGRDVPRAEWVARALEAA